VVFANLTFKVWDQLKDNRETKSETPLAHCIKDLNQAEYPWTQMSFSCCTYIPEDTGPEWHFAPRDVATGSTTSHSPTKPTTILETISLANGMYDRQYLHSKQRLNILLC